MSEESKEKTAEELPSIAELEKVQAAYREEVQRQRQEQQAAWSSQIEEAEKALEQARALEKEAGKITGERRPEVEAILVSSQEVSRYLASVKGLVEGLPFDEVSEPIKKYFPGHRRGCQKLLSAWERLRRI